LALLGAPWAQVGGEEGVGLKACTAYQKTAILRSELGQIVVIADTVPPPSQTTTGNHNGSLP
jgi:hypothetical protein